MRRALAILIAVSFVAMGWTPSAMAGAKLNINDKAQLDLGIRIQPYVISVEKDVDGDGKWDSFTDYKMRRARLRLKATIGEYVEGFIQTEVSGSPSGAVGRPARVIDAFVVLKANKWVRFYNGINMVPAYRQNLTSSGAMLAIERPSMAYKDLSWGNRGFVNFATATLAQSDSKLRGEDDVRDEGVTLFGSGRLGDDSKASLKYYLGIYDGVQTAGEHNDRFAGRVQLNFFDAEPGYYNSAMYLGKKKTIGIGAAFDMQAAVANDVADTTNVTPADYSLITADAFIEWPIGDGSLTAEVGWSQLDLSDAMAMVGTSTVDWRAVQGSGFYVQGGYLINEKWQPWAEFEQWSSDSDADVGNWTIYRVGISYFIEGQNANLKFGYENLSTDTPIAGEEDSQNTIVFGTFITY